MNRPTAGISAETPDWEREKKQPGTWDPGRSLLAAIRDYQRLCAARGSWNWLPRKIAVIRHRWWSAVTGADIPLNCSIGGGLLIPHPNGIVLHPDVRIGPNCLLFQQVIIGAGPSGVPTVGGHVDIGAGAKIIGKITVHDHAVIGANAVVTRDVPRGATVGGVPARVIR